MIQTDSLTPVAAVVLLINETLTSHRYTYQQLQMYICIYIYICSINVTNCPIISPDARILNNVTYHHNVTYPCHLRNVSWRLSESIHHFIFHSNNLHATLLLRHTVHLFPHNPSQPFPFMISQIVTYIYILMRKGLLLKKMDCNLIACIYIIGSENKIMQLPINVEE